MTEWAIRVKDLRKEYRGRNGPVHAVNGIDLEIQPGECFGLLGPNGAGKTTTVEILEGLNQPTSGEVEILGLHWRNDARAIRERIGVTLQETRLPDKETVHEIVTVFRSFYKQGVNPEDVIGAWRLRARRTLISNSSPVASNSDWRSHYRWSAIPSCYSSTSRRRAWIPSHAVNSGM